MRRLLDKTMVLNSLATADPELADSWPHVDRFVEQLNRSIKGRLLQERAAIDKEIADLGAD